MTKLLDNLTWHLICIFFAEISPKKGHNVASSLTIIVLELHIFNSLNAKSVPAGIKLVLFGRYVLNIYVGIVQ